MLYSIVLWFVNSNSANKGSWGLIISQYEPQISSVTLIMHGDQRICILCWETWFATTPIDRPFSARNLSLIFSSFLWFTANVGLLSYSFSWIIVSINCSYAPADWWLVSAFRNPGSLAVLRPESAIWKEQLLLFYYLWNQSGRIARPIIFKGRSPV